MENPENVEHMMNNIIEKDAGLVLVPCKAGELLKTAQFFNMMGRVVIPTYFVGFFEVGTFASRVNPGHYPIFQFLKSFQITVWLTIFISIIILSLVSSIKSQNLIRIFKFILNYFEVLFSKTLQGTIAQYEV